MGRLFKMLIPLLLIAFGVLWPVVFSAGFDGAAGNDGGTAEDPVRITEYRAHYTVSADGDLHAVETITGDFPSGRHGIFRYWDITNQNNPNVRQVPAIESVLLDGDPEPYQMLWEGRERFRVAKIGDADWTLNPGSHVYEIRYSVPGVLDRKSVV